MDLVKNGVHSILNRVPILIPALRKRGDVWEADLPLQDKRISAVFKVAMAFIAVNMATAAFSTTPFLLVAVPIIAAAAYFLVQLDTKRASIAVKKRNREEFCQVKVPSEVLMRRIAYYPESIKKVIALNGDLNKKDSRGKTLLDRAMSADRESPRNRVQFLLDHGASPLQGTSLIKAIAKEKYRCFLPLLIEAFKEEELASLKKEVTQLAKILHALFYRNQTAATIDFLLAKLKITLGNLQQLSEEYPEFRLATLAVRLKALTDATPL